MTRDGEGRWEADLHRAIAAILAGRAQTPTERALLAGVSGIDGSGKGFLAERIVARLRERDISTALLGVDGWLHLPHRRFSRQNPARHFYEHALRLEEMFCDLVLPLRDTRSVRLVADYAEETASVYRTHLYEFTDVDVIVLEGIYLFKPAYRGHFDLTFWVDCSFETALRRALRRGQEGLPPDETIRAYETIYFPAQRIHFERDDPRSAAGSIIVNDPLLDEAARRTAGASSN